MTDQQLYLSIGIPSVLIVLSWLLQSQRLNAIDARLQGIETALRGVYEMAGRHDKAIETLEKRPA